MSYTINTERRNIKFFVDRYKVMTKEEAEKEIELISDTRIPEHLTTGSRKDGRETTNLPWHAIKNTIIAKMAFGHVYNDEPLPGDPLGNRKKKERELAILNAKLDEAKLDEDIAKTQAKIDKIKQKKENERKRTVAEKA